MTTNIIAHFALFLLIWGCNTTQSPDNVFTADVIIYGGTSAAVTAAIETQQNGNTVIIVSPDLHLGGLTTGGLGWTDTGKKETIGGLSREFYHRVWEFYTQNDAWYLEKKEEYDNGREFSSINDIEQTMWVFEPHVAEQIIDEWIAEKNIPVYRNEWLDRENGVVKKDGKIESLTTLTGNTFLGKMFIDATYEGDLMAASAVSYHVGRESNDTYNEKWNGVQTGVLHHKHFFQSNISPYKIPGDSESGLLPLISGEDPGKYGAEDDKVQAYCFRMCMTDDPENRLAFPKPDNYDPLQYELLHRVFQAGYTDIYMHVGKFDPLPNRKTDTNNRGPLSSDHIGMNYEYPDASYERRMEIIKEHRDYQMGLYWFTANDPRVPDPVRSEMQKWGLAKDEFMDNGNWPHQLYVREARRMIGEYVTTEHDLLGKNKVQKPIGMGSYGIDSHNIQRYVTPEGFVQNEGDVGVGTPPYSIPYNSLIPKKEECKNLIVPVCLSSSHIAFGSIRMEPVFMILGQSAACVASLALANESSVQDISYNELQKELRSKGQVLTVDDMKKK